jgi:hypothetical protein
MLGEKGRKVIFDGEEGVRGGDKNRMNFFFVYYVTKVGKQPTTMWVH